MDVVTKYHNNEFSPSFPQFYQVVCHLNLFSVKLHNMNDSDCFAILTVIYLKLVSVCRVSFET